MTTLSTEAEDASHNSSQHIIRMSSQYSWPGSLSQIFSMSYFWLERTSDECTRFFFYKSFLKTIFSFLELFILWNLSLLDRFHLLIDGSFSSYDGALFMTLALFTSYYYARYTINMKLIHEPLGTETATLRTGSLIDSAV
jgi:hypothetical protein